MKKIAVVAANGKVAKKVIAEAVGRGFDVTGFGRHENDTQAQHYVKKDLFDLTADDVKGFDAVVDAFGAWTEETLPLHSKSLKHLADILSGSDTRLVVVGGAGGLYTDKTHTLRVVDTPEFPAEYKALSLAQAKSFEDVLRDRKDVRWTYICPAGDFQPDGERTGKYILASEELTLNSKGESIISYADYAIALVDEIEKGSHIQQRISVVQA